MKRVAVLLALVALLAGCGNHHTDPTPASPSVTVTLPDPAKCPDHDYCLL